MNFFNGFGGCGCGCEHDCGKRCGSDSCELILLLIILDCFCGHGDRGCGGFGGDSCSIIWIIMLLSCFCGGRGDKGCGCNGFEKNCCK